MSEKLDRVLLEIGVTGKGNLNGFSTKEIMARVKILKDTGDLKGSEKHGYDITNQGRKKFEQMRGGEGK